MSLLMLEARPPDTIRNSAANTFSFLQDAHTRSRAVSTSQPARRNTQRTHTHHTHTQTHPFNDPCEPAEWLAEFVNERS